MLRTTKFFSPYIRSVLSSVLVASLLLAPTTPYAFADQHENLINALNDDQVFYPGNIRPTTTSTFIDPDGLNINEESVENFNKKGIDWADQHESILWKLFEIQTHKKVKGFYEELLVLEDLQIKIVLRLMRAKLLIETVAKGEKIAKETLHSEAIKNYKSDKLRAIETEFKALNITLILSEVRF